MKRDFNQKGSKALALSILGGSVLSPAVVSADNIFGPIQTNNLEKLEKEQGVEVAKVEDLDNAIKTYDDSYTIIFGEEEGGSIEQGAEYLIYPAYLTLKNGKSVKLDGSKNEKIKEFIEENSVIATAGEEDSKVNVNYDGVYHVKQIKRAPGSYLHAMLDEDRRGEGFYGEGETLGFEFPKMEGGIVSNEQTHIVDPKNTDVDSGTKEPLIGGADAETIIGNILVAKYGDENKDLGHITEDDSFNEVDENFAINTLEGARFTIKQLKKPTETERNFVGNTKVGSKEVAGADSDDLKNKATFEEVSGDKYFAELNVHQDNISITGKKGDFDGLPEGVYEIDEVQAPKGFTRTEMKIKITVTVAENGVDRIVMVGDGTEDRVDGKGLYKVSSGESYNYGLKVNNYRKPGTDPKNPLRKMLNNNGYLHGFFPGVHESLAPGYLFSFNIEFPTPKDINEYEYFEIYDDFDKNLDISKLKVKLKKGQKKSDGYFDIESAKEIEDSKYKVHKKDNQVKIVFSDELIKELSNEDYIQVQFNNISINKDMTSQEAQNIFDNPIEKHLYNEAKLHFVNGSGFTVNPKDPTKDPDENNPHMKPNEEDPFDLTEDVVLPEIPSDSDPIRIPEVPTSNKVKFIPYLRDFEFKKVDRSGAALEGAKFLLEVVEYEIEEGPSGNQIDEDYKDKNKVEINKDGEIIVGGEKLNNSNAVAVSDEDGVVRFQGIPAGTYNIREIEAPDGFRLSNEPIEVFNYIQQSPSQDLDANVFSTSSLTLRYDGEQVESSSSILVKDGEDYLEVVNYKYNETPKTGTLGRLPYVGAGMIVLTVGVITLKKKED